MTTGLTHPIDLKAVKILENVEGRWVDDGVGRTTEMARLEEWEEMVVTHETNTTTSVVKEVKCHNGEFRSLQDSKGSITGIMNSDRWIRRHGRWIPVGGLRHLWFVKGAMPNFHAVDLSPD